MDFDFSENLEVDNIQKVPEQFRGLYVPEGEDGKHVISQEDSVQGALSAIMGLNKSLAASRKEFKENKNKQVDLSALSDFGSTVEEIKETFENKITELTNELSKGEEGKLNLDKIKEDLKRAHSKELEQKDVSINTMKGSLEKYLVNAAAVEAISGEKGVPDLLLPHIQKQTKVIEAEGDFHVIVVDNDGDARISTATGNPMTIKDLVKEMKGSETFGRAFESESPAGGGTPPSGQRHQHQEQVKEKTATEKIAAGLRAKR